MLRIVFCHYIVLMIRVEEFSIADSYFNGLLFAFACALKFTFPTYMDYPLVAYHRRRGHLAIPVQDRPLTALMTDRQLLEDFLDRNSHASDDHQSSPPLTKHAHSPLS